MIKDDIKFGNKALGLILLITNNNYSVGFYLSSSILLYP